MENKKETAVEWFFDKIKTHFEHDGDLYESVVMTYAIAKVKEKKQIVNAVNGFPINNRDLDGEDYYNETYKNNG